MTLQQIAEMEAAVEADDVDRARAILAATSDSKGLSNTIHCGGKPLVISAHSVEMAKTLVEHGADLELVSRWWSSGISVNPGVDPAVGRFLVERGAALTPHAAAGLGLVDALRDMLAGDPKLVHAKGGDGCTPLHFSRNTETTELLIARGADVDARDEDHDSTPAQWLIGSSPDVSAFLLERGATPDIFLAAALGDLSLCERLVKADRSCLTHRIGKAPFHPIGYLGRGGTILQWTLGFNCYAHQVAARTGHEQLLDFLTTESDVTTRFLVACVMPNRPAAEAIAAAHPELVAALQDVDRELVARYCWETNLSLEAVRLMLDVGFPVDFPETSHGYTPLHNAAWCGCGDLVELLVERGHPVDLRDPNYDSTPLGFALHCCLHEGRHPDGEYGRVVAALIDAGCTWDRSIFPTGNGGIDEALRKRLAVGDH